ncbi:uncharacterized protein LY79DRAFT_553768 [Colletotrichum navitas]|uniref:Uncharacterized protein n=1 Tax=Colletotrichum navitas TaxID=681940 RepID=A0AAD8PYZ4_9PEZI|nr:uncharacterized protein LY79DRAFT_553768 [Colletotrichum navitas]KAK1590698.1 hypothetical protein LY79DRAFT_553768 [Colletotrichum navitas]
MERLKINQDSHVTAVQSIVHYLSDQWTTVPCLKPPARAVSPYRPGYCCCSRATGCPTVLLVVVVVLATMYVMHVLVDMVVLLLPGSLFGSSRTHVRVCSCRIAQLDTSHAADQAAFVFPFPLIRCLVFPSLSRLMLLRSLAVALRCRRPQGIPSIMSLTT